MRDGRSTIRSDSGFSELSCGITCWARDPAPCLNQWIDRAVSRWNNFFSQDKASSLSIYSLVKILYIEYDHVFVHAFCMIFSEKITNDLNTRSRVDINSIVVTHFRSSEWTKNTFLMFRRTMILLRNFLAWEIHAKFMRD